MLTALGKWTELGTHVRGAVRNGVSELEIREALLQATFVSSIFFLPSCVECVVGGREIY
jgi:alkylhydroperoxidase/carboxymuconolactone decarboxylase family protein YurZ